MCFLPQDFRSPTCARILPVLLISRAQFVCVGSKRERERERDGAGFASRVRKLSGIGRRDDLGFCFEKKETLNCDKRFRNAVKNFVLPNNFL